MQRKSVSSSNLATVGYDAENQILEIEMNRFQLFRQSSCIRKGWGTQLQSL